MIKSMTGYGRAQSVVNNKDITIEIKSVNHRFFDFNTRIPRIYGFLEEKLKAHIQKQINRGKIDVFVYIVNSSESSVEVSLDRALLNGYLKSLYAMRDEFNLIDDISVSTIARNNDIFVIKKTEEDADSLWEDVKTVTDIAIKDFMTMRAKEGEKLKIDMLNSCDKIMEKVGIIEERSPETAKEYRAKLEERIKELIGDTNVDENRLIMETAIFADKIAVNEEVVRLKSHVSQLQGLLNLTVPIGKKLDFIVQEMNREINTIGSKANDLEITRNVVDVKAEIEKIREQIQNIE